MWSPTGGRFDGDEILACDRAGITVTLPKPQTSWSKAQGRFGEQRRITRWEHEEVLEAVQRRLEENPQAMRQRREIVGHPFGTIKARMGVTNFLMRRLKNLRAEMDLSVLAYNLTRVMNILGIGPLIAAIRA